MAHTSMAGHAWPTMACHGLPLSTTHAWPASAWPAMHCLPCMARHACMAHAPCMACHGQHVWRTVLSICSQPASGELLHDHLCLYLGPCAFGQHYVGILAPFGCVMYTLNSSRSFSNAAATPARMNAFTSAAIRHKSDILDRPSQCVMTWMTSCSRSLI